MATFLTLGEDDSSHPPPPPLAEILRKYQHNYTHLFITYCSLPSRPGKEICMKYMRSGDCVNGKACRYDHPIERFGSQDVASSPAQAVVNLLGNVCSLCSNVSVDATGVLTSFISDLVAVLDKYFDELSSDYGSGCIIYGDSVLKVHEAFNTFRKRITPKRRKGASKSQDRDLGNMHDLEQFEDSCKTLLPCLKYLNTRWSEEENLFSSVLQCSVAFPVNSQLLPALDQDIHLLADKAKDQQAVHKDRKEHIRLFLLSIANSVLNAHIQERNQDVSLLNSCVLKPFGSSANSLGSSSSDLDLCLGYEETLKVSLAARMMMMMMMMMMIVVVVMMKTMMMIIIIYDKSYF
jgi:hypothetical protein